MNKMCDDDDVPYVPRLNVVRQSGHVDVMPLFEGTFTCSVRQFLQYKWPTSQGQGQDVDYDHWMPL